MKELFPCQFSENLTPDKPSWTVARDHMMKEGFFSKADVLKVIATAKTILSKNDKKTKGICFT